MDKWAGGFLAALIIFAMFKIAAYLDEHPIGWDIEDAASEQRRWYEEHTGWIDPRRR